MTSHVLIIILKLEYQHGASIFPVKKERKNSAAKVPLSFLSIRKKRTNGAPIKLLFNET